MKTLADYPELMFELRVHRDSMAVFDPARGTTEVIAPCCGRRCAADCILDVREVPGTIVKGGGHQEPKDHDWLCDGCRDRMIREPSNDWSTSKLFEAAGADPATVRQIKIRERVDQLEREDMADGGSHDVATARQRAATDVDRAIAAAEAAA